MRFADHADAHFTQSRIAQRNSGVSVKQQLVNGLSLLQTRQCAVLPQDRSNVRLGSQKSLMSAP